MIEEAEAKLDPFFVSSRFLRGRDPPLVRALSVRSRIWTIAKQMG